MVESTNLLKIVAGDSLGVFLSRVISIPLGYITGIAIARFFGAEAMGTYFIALSLIGILTPFLHPRVGLRSCAFRFGNQGRPASRKFEANPSVQPGPGDRAGQPGCIIFIDWLGFPGGAFHISGFA